MPFAYRILILVFLILIPLQSARLGLTVEAAEGTPDAQAAKEQLELNRDSLFNGSTEAIRVKVAMFMLDGGSEPARQVLLEALNQKENVGARVAVCRALSQARMENKSLSNKDVFIEPLLGILKEADPAQAKLASEVTLIFDYQVVGTRLEGLAKDPSASVPARLNAIMALQLQPDSRAVTTMLELVDDDNEQVGNAARDALHAMRIPVGNDAQARGLYIQELQDKSKDEFLRDWLIQQENRMRQERAQNELWVELYFKSIDQFYVSIADKDAQQRAAYLITHLKAQQVERTLWALQKVYEWRLKGEAIPEDLIPALVGLVASNNRSVRLEAARQLSYMGRLESADNLLAQLDKEKDDEVRTELFTALGAACKSALLNGGIPGETKTKILSWAARFLNEKDEARATKGADVIGKLLEKNGLPAQDIGKYLDLFTDRYNKSEANTLSAELLRTMTSLCAERSGCKNEARQRFKAIFAKAITDETDRVREEAVLGLVNVDKVLALNSLRGSLTQEKNARIRTCIIEMTSEVGDAQDLMWLLANVGSEAETESSWQAILKILARSDPKLLAQWMPRLAEARQQGRVTDGLWQTFLKDAERKAEKDPAVLNEVLRLWADFHQQKGDLKQARGYLQRQLQASPGEKKASLETQIFAVDLQLEDVKTATATLQTILNQRDLDENEGLVQAVNSLLKNDSPEKTHQQTIAAVVKGIKIEQARPNWDKLKARWASAYAKQAVVGTAKQE